MAFFNTIGRLDSVTNVRFKVSEFNGSFSAMNLKSGWSTPDPKEPVTSSRGLCLEVDGLQTLRLFILQRLRRGEKALLYKAKQQNSEPVIPGLPPGNQC
jgi:hypothetical protein